MTPEWISEEMEEGGGRFRRKRLYTLMMKYFLPLIMPVLFLQPDGVLSLFRR